MSARRIFVTAWLAILASAGSLSAQTEIPPVFEFSFSNPGARSMGFGGAFVALADDATAAFANPAGLVQLGAPEVSLEGRHWSYSTPYVSGGRLFGSPTGIGQDYSAGLRTDTSDKDLSGLSFLSFVYPGDRWAIAFYRHLLSKYEFESASEGIYSGPWSETNFIRREFGFQKYVDLQIVSYALAGAYEITETLSLGLAINFFECGLSAVTDVFGRVQDNTPPEEFFAPIPFTPENLTYSASIAVDDEDWGMNLGLHWRPTGQWSFGGFFRQGPRFDTVIQQQAGPAFWIPEMSGQVFDRHIESVKFPNVYGLGATYRSRDDRVTLSLEWDRVEYSSILSEDSNLDIDDANELHLGGEYAFLDLSPIVSVRAGVWRDPDHQIVYSGPNYLAEAVLAGGDDSTHFAAGLGLAFQTVQVDLAADFSELVDALSLSLIYSF